MLYPRRRNVLPGLRTPLGVKVYGAVALTVVGLTGGFFLGRGTAPRFPPVGVSITTWEDDHSIGFRVVDSYSLEETTLLEGGVYCNAEGVAADFTGPYVPVTGGQMDAFAEGVTGLCAGDIPLLYKSQLVVTTALSESGILGQVVDSRRLELGGR